MMIPRLIEEMIHFYDGSHHDICHFLKVHAYARTIGLRENLPEDKQLSLEAAAVLHDIACPLCREKYGKADAAHQEQEGPALAAVLLEKVGADSQLKNRVCYLVGHHHTHTFVDAPDHRILLEADFLVNAYEGNLDKEAVRGGAARLFRTETGLRLLRSMYKYDEE